MSSSAADWSSLPAELLQTIAGDLKTIPDYIRFRSVCPFWRAAAELRPGFVPQEFPRLMLPLNQSSVRGCFFNPLTNSRHYCRCLPDPSASHRCIGSYLGRLILIDISLDMVVLNPITGEKTSLPPLSSFLKYRSMNSKCNCADHYSLEKRRDNLQIKVILTPPNSPDPNNFFAFAISYPRFNLVEYCKHGSRWWRPVINDDRTLGAYEDAIYFKGKLYLVDSHGSLSICDFKEHDTPTIYSIMTTKNTYSIMGDGQIGVGCNMKYLVDVGGEMLLVERYIEWDRKETVTFYVWKFDWSAQEWDLVTSLGDSILFVGLNSSSFAVTASEYSGCKGNRIYFTGNYYPNYYDAGVYNLDNGVVERIDLYDRETQMLCHRSGCSPVWFTPSLW